MASHTTPDPGQDVQESRLLVTNTRSLREAATVTESHGGVVLRNAVNQLLLGEAGLVVTRE